MKTSFTPLFMYFLLIPADNTRLSAQVTTGSGNTPEKDAVSCSNSNLFLLRNTQIIGLREQGT